MQEIIKIRAKISVIEIIHRTDQARVGTWQKYKTDKLLAKLAKRKRKPHINEIRGERGKLVWVPMKWRETLGEF